MRKVRRYLNLAIMILLVFMLFVQVVNINGAINLVPLKKVGGTNLKYRNSAVEVMIPSDYEQPETDFRGVWVTPLTGDIARFTSEIQYKAQINEVFDIMEYYNMNAIIFHIRIMNDALYNSQYNKWSSYYNTNPSWDALPWMIEEAHKRGIEFHAWMNPYRVTNSHSGSLSTLAQNYPTDNAASNPNNMLQAGSKVILNPGEPAVRQFLYDTVLEVVEKYDVDGIHFDDYFYISGVDDSTTRAKYNTTGMSIDNWRRKQVDTFIEELHYIIEDFNLDNNRRVQLGISPSGIYRNGNGIVTYDEFGTAITNGSNTSGMEHYGNYLYSDSKKWIDEEWIDYILPQSYWGFEHPVAGFADVMDWWIKVAQYKNVNLYSGMGIYMATESSNTYSWKTNPKEAYNQVLYLSKYDKAKGVSIYSFRYIESAFKNQSTTNLNYVNMKEIKDHLWNKPAILPEVATENLVMPKNVNDLNISTTSQNNTLTWQADSSAKYYVIYKSDSLVTYSSDEVYKIVGNTSVNGTQTFIDSNTSSEYYGVKPMSISNTLGEGARTLDDVEKYYTVTFYDFDGNIAKEETVLEGNSATAPVLSSNQYNFLGWDKEFSNVTSNLQVYPLYDINKYKVTFYDAYNNIVKVELVEKGSSATPPASPTKKADIQYTYVFAGWDTNYTNVISNLIVKPQFNEIINKYTVTFYNGNEMLQRNIVEYGSSVVAPISPTKEKDAQYTYTFSHWDKDFSNITTNLDIYAVYDTTLNEYMVRFFDATGSTVISQMSVKYGQSVTPPRPPRRDSTAQYSYQFDRWDKNFTYITGNLDVYPLYNESINSYNVKFYDEDGITLLIEEVVEYGTSANAPTPLEKEGYIFIGWDKDYTYITSDLEVIANYESILNEYTVKFYDEDGITLLKEVVIFEGQIPETPIAPIKDATDKFTFEFIGWDKDINNITSDISVKAVYDAIINKYTVKFYDEDGTTLLDEIMVEFGSSAITDIIPSKNASDEYTFEFSGWDKDISNVTNNIEVIAMYTSTVKKVDVNFYIEDEIVSTIQVEYGNKITKPVTPTKEGYEFIGWYLNGEEFDFDSTITDNLDLNAKWSKVPFGCNLGSNELMITMFSLVTLAFYLLRRKPY